MITEIFFDIETKKIFDDIEGFNPADLGISIVSILKRQLDDNLQEINSRIQSFWEEEFTSMWPFFTNADRIIGFNSLNFDVLALAPLAPFDFKKLNHFDILEKIKTVLGHRLSLHALASETLNHTKIDHGLNAVKYWAEHSRKSLAKLKKYCEDDVLVTKEIYDFALKNKFLKFKDKWNTPRQFPIDFSYPAKTSTPQLGLF